MSSPQNRGTDCLSLNNLTHLSRMSRAVQKKVEKNAEELHDILAHSLNCLQRIRHRVVHVKDLVQTQKKVADGRQICSLSALPLGKCDLFPFLPLLIIKRLSAPRFMNTAIMDNGNIVPLALFKVEFKSAIIPIGVIHHEEGAELVFLGQSEEIVLNNRTNCIDYPMLYS